MDIFEESAMPTNPPMRLAYVISAVSTDNTGMGGHYRSALILAEAMASEGIAVEIVTLGDIFPAPFKDATVNVTHIDFRPARSYYARVMSALKLFEPTHIHAFDNKSYFFARLAARTMDRPVFLTKPGGPNRRTFFPYCKDIIGFSEENIAFLKKKKNLRNSTFHYLPNRVTAPVHDEAKVAALRSRLGISSDDVVVLRICRIGNYYKQSIAQTYGLTERLRRSGIKARALIIGFIQDQEIFDEIAGEVGIPKDIVTDPLFTERASDLLHVGDIVIGTGRSFMEAAMQGRLCATPLIGQSSPCLVDPENFEQLAETNFSERNSLPHFDEHANAERFANLLKSPEARDKHASAIQAIVDTRFGMRGAVRKYMSIYSARKHYSGASISDYLGNSLGVIRFYAPLAIRRGE